MQRRNILTALSCIISALVITMTANAKSDDIAIDEQNFPEIRSAIEHYDLDRNGYLSPEENKSIKSMYLSNKHLTSIKGIELLTSLETLWCSETLVEEIAEFPNSLKGIHINETPIKELPELPDNLEILHCQFNELETLPKLPESLLELDCSGNQLKELPELPDNMHTLVLVNNKITKFPELPDTLTYLGCARNPLKELKELPKELEELYCHETELSGTLDLTKYTNLQKLNCRDNELEKILLNPNNTFIFLNVNDNCLKTPDNVSGVATTIWCEQGFKFCPQKSQEHIYGQSYFISPSGFISSGKTGQNCTICHKTLESIIPKVKTIELSSTKTVYTGDLQRPGVVVKDTENKQLKEDVDYTVSYTSDGKKVGKHGVTVNLKGIYNGSKTVEYTIIPDTPKTMHAELYGYNDIEVSWTKSTGATGYDVYYKGPNISFYKKLDTITETSYRMKNVESGKKYTFKIVPFYSYYKNNSTKKYISPNYTVDSVYTLKKLGQPTIKDSTKSYVEVHWNNISGETGYEISRSSKKDGTYVVKTVETVSKTSAKVYAKKDTIYYYKVRAYKKLPNGNIIKGPWSKAKAYNRREIKKVKGLKVNLCSHDDVKITWTTTSGANKYWVYYKKAGASSYTYYKALKGTSCTITNLADGVKYTFKIVPKYTKDDVVLCTGSGTSASLYTLKKLNAPSISKATSNEVNVTWENISGETGYEISRSSQKNGTYVVLKLKTVSQDSTSVYAKKGTTYYYKVRAYKKLTDGTIVRGPWSKAKTYKLR